MKHTLIFSLVVFLFMAACGGDRATLDPSVATVAKALRRNELGIEAESLSIRGNPNGRGVFVYSAQTRFAGVERYIIWLVLDGMAYPINGATKGVTPSLPWPRECDPAQWATTGLYAYSATEALQKIEGKP